MKLFFIARLVFRYHILKINMDIQKLSVNINPRRLKLRTKQMTMVVSVEMYQWKTHQKTMSPFETTSSVVTMNHSVSLHYLCHVTSTEHNLNVQALGRNGDVPETTFTNFHISEYLKSFDSETNYIGLMITNVKYDNEWYHDGRKHDNIRMALNNAGV